MDKMQGSIVILQLGAITLILVLWFHSWSRRK